jgi:hypothetical protein
MKAETPRCPESVRLARLASSSDDPALRAHVIDCETCRAQRASLRRLAALARALPDPPIRDQRRDRARARLVASVENLTPRRRAAAARRAWPAVTLAVGGVAAAAAAGVAILALRAPAAPGPAVAEAVARPEPSRHRGAVRSKGDARFTWSALPDEVVRLHDGAVSVQVTPLGPGERFRVVAGDGEVEVHGTAFDVVVEDDRLVSVTVDHGLVEVRPAHGPRVFLHAAESWQAPAPAGAASAAVEQEEPPRPTESAAAHGFARGWRALRGGDYLAAAAAFGRAAEADPADPISEDARYWRAVALARGGRPAAARAEMAAFLTRYPTSPRAGEISAMLGWLLLDVHDRAGARRRFRAAADDRADAVRASARAGLQALAEAEPRAAQ